MKNYNVISALKRDGVRYEKGAVIELDPSDAAQLVKDGVIAPLGDAIELSGETVDFEVTQEWLDANPDAEDDEGEPVKLGDIIQVPKEVVEVAKPKGRKPRAAAKPGAKPKGGKAAAEAKVKPEAGKAGDSDDDDANAL